MAAVELSGLQLHVAATRVGPELSGFQMQVALTDADTSVPVPPVLEWIPTYVYAGEGFGWLPTFPPDLLTTYPPQV